MQITSAQKRRVALFFLLGAAIFIGLVAIIAGNKLLKREDCYYTRFEDASVAGLTEGSSVKFQGMNIGTVSAISIDRDNTAVVQINFCLKPGVPIKEGTTSQLGNIGITGLKFLELQGGGTGEDIPTGEEVPSSKSSWDVLSGQTTVIAAKLELILNRVNILLSEMDPAHLGMIVTNVEGITGSIDSLLKTNIDQVESILQRTDSLLANADVVSRDFARVSTNLVRFTAKDGPANKVIASLEENVRILQGDYQEADLINQLATVFELVVSMQKTMDTINLTLMRSQENITSSFMELHEGMINFNEFTRIIMENPAAIIQGRGSEETR